jgi:RNA polymerase sigma-70 factor (ECF subfamily)
VDDRVLADRRRGHPRLDGKLRMHMDRTDQDWIEELGAEGTPRNEALSALRGVLVSRLRRAFQGRAGADDSLLEDAVQQALIKVLENLDRFRGKSRFTTWASSIAVRETLTELRRRHRMDVSLDRLLEEEKGAPVILDRNVGPLDRAARGAIEETLLRIMNTALTSRQRTALLAELHGVPLDEIGRRLGSNRNAIYKLTHDARKRLRAELESVGYTADDLLTQDERR